MAEETNIVLTNDNAVLGKTEVNPNVLEVIAGIAANEVDGVFRMHGSIGNQVSELFGRVEHGKGVKLVVNDDTLVFDVYVYLNYGVSVPKVALNIQEHIKSQISAMTELTITEINVHVEGVIPEKMTKESKVDINNLFPDDIEEAGEK
ncbi:Asp23/Gls24 family envelope stress response protein [Periweissella beninensis]|uniref:Asp23/Gls24 family envelope stress response protein n=1 Tax=Periweissella beninensis TaxID=504936 RepID=A0ABT0VHT7_9LACO|nr:Asp23/Gls24 family envelope stress response protein [Periweissella beninensis]MBM7544045.1 putative alkaline shock family protein YloU [Periweissella beninensis]MCM2437398.1 Asp23/Gls24 family envelope stress response protein [Periweissella beninensis]MCT4396398.1 Asp23/Gls24 family envelope stress response protein [Periweissella beninensis]